MINVAQCGNQFLRTVIAVHARKRRIDCEIAIARGGLVNPFYRIFKDAAITSLRFTQGFVGLLALCDVLDEAFEYVEGVM